jgi:6-pyruvoyltetrahydropterin/6-carboxytetrahydropterin synthase
VNRALNRAGRRAGCHGGRVELSRRYTISASHRLYSEKLSAEENQRVFGKCANPYGHGHNYVVEVTLSGPVDPATGMIANLSELDAFVAERVLEPMDHRNLNEEVAIFRQLVPTTENLCVEIYNRLRDFPGARLVKVRIEETSKNSFEYAGEAAT